MSAQLTHWQEAIESFQPHVVCAASKGGGDRTSGTRASKNGPSSYPEKGVIAETYGCGSKIGTQNGSLANGNMD